MYIYEMHQHTASCSKCAKADTIELIHALKDAGISGVVLTNHFYHGNSAIDRSLSWKDFCMAYANDYYVAKNEGEKLDFDVLFGIEEGIGKPGNGKEALIYGLLPENIISHPELRERDLSLLSNVVRSEGGLLVQAHPFRNRSYINDPDEKLPMEYFDGIEGYNMANTQEENLRAIEYAKESNVFITAGSDSHDVETSPRFGISCEHRIKNEKELKEVLLKGEYSLYLGK